MIIPTMCQPLEYFFLGRDEDLKVAYSRILKPKRKIIY